MYELQDLYWKWTVYCVKVVKKNLWIPISIQNLMNQFVILAGILI